MSSLGCSFALQQDSESPRHTNQEGHTMTTKLSHTFTAAGRTFTVHASATVIPDYAPGVDGYYGAHVTEEGTEELAYNGNLRDLEKGTDPVVMLGLFVATLVHNVTEQAEQDAAATYAAAAVEELSPAELAEMEAEEEARMEEDARLEQELEALSELHYAQDRERMAEAGGWFGYDDSEPVF